MIKPFNLPHELDKHFLELSRLSSLFEITTKITRKFILKNKLFNKINEILLSISMIHQDYNKAILALQIAFNSDKDFLEEVKTIQKELGGNIQYYSKNQLINAIIKDEISILVASKIPIDEFISLFLIFLLGKIKNVTHEITFSFKLYDEGRYLINIWAKNEVIKKTVLPALNYLYSTNNDLYLNFKAKYPFKDKNNEIHNLLVKFENIRELKILISSHLLDLKLNENNSLSEGYRVSYGIYIILEILLYSKINQDKAKRLTNILFENWISLSYDTELTNFNDLEIQSHKVLNEFENLYLSQLTTLELNFKEIIQTWEVLDESIFGLKKLIESFYDESNNQSQLLDIISENSREKKKDIVLEIIICESLSLLGINNYHKAYIIYTINRLLHEA